MRKSQGDFRLHFGMGAEPKAMLSVRWPDGKAEDLGRVEANHWITVRQGKGIVERRKLAAK